MKTSSLNIDGFDVRYSCPDDMFEDFINWVEGKDSGLYISSLKYDFGQREEEFSEQVTIVGNTKMWKNTNNDE